MMAPALDRRSCLYHYTSATGLDGILGQRMFRATDTDFLNDWKEIIYVAQPLIPRMGDLVDAAIEYDAKHDPLQKTRTRMAESAQDAIKRFTHLDEDMPAPHPGQYVDGATYVACSSKDHDQLGQWRAYGQGGYSIGFTKTGLEAVSADLRKIVYGDTGVVQTCDEILEYLRIELRRRHTRSSEGSYFAPTDSIY
jgi:hypothetical protein